ncbi:hypothetical protein E1B28_005408 [Marasmius oreades]|uniref:Protein kinase domain-containing protein n=1 Tax=Marasmius oreades TaxID=181124 RepID=A0A9P7S3T1_9AGAR|nr:uncharacterized protein E1B28_005408 [Marasmius oreades]KAG7094582.1 hypothetical protein E1B28_005408 [Marasmius oreades]
MVTRRIIADFCREALIWTQLRHSNVLPLLGVNTELFPSCFCLVSPWMENGDIVSFLKMNPNHDKLQPICEIMAGLEYLHTLSPPIAHGDIKGANILVDEEHHCRLADFGLAAISAETMTMIHTTTGVIKGSIRWMAPELYAFATGTVEKNAKEDRTPRDIYAFACTVLEMLTGKPPFSNLIDAAVIYQVSVRRIRPERPSEGWCPNHIWNLVESCWDEDPLKRPRAKALHMYLQQLMLSGNPDPGDPGFIGYFQPEGFGTLASAEPDYDTIESDHPPESYVLPPQSPKVLSPLPLKLPQTFNSEGIAEAEDIPSPTSPSASQYVAEFFRLNERLLKEAVDNTSSYGQNMPGRGIPDPCEYVRTACEGLHKYSDVFVGALEVIARLHPFIGVTIVAFKLSIVWLYDKQIHDKDVIDLMIQIHRTMALFLRLRKLSNPEDRGTDGQTLWDRLQDLLVILTTVIEQAGAAIEAFARGSITLERVTLYSGKFSQFQEALRRAFSYHPALSDPSFTLQSFATNGESSQREEHWNTRIDNLVSQFRALPSIAKEDTYLPVGVPASRDPSYTSSQGTRQRRRRRHSNPQQWNHEEPPTLLSSSPSESHLPGSFGAYVDNSLGERLLSARTLPPSSSEFHLVHDDYGDGEEVRRTLAGTRGYDGTNYLVGEPLYPQASVGGTVASFHGPSKTSTPFISPPPAHRVTTFLILNPLLSANTTLLTFDFADDSFKPGVQSFPPPTLSSLNHPSLQGQATHVEVSAMRLVFDDNDFVVPPSTIGLSHLDVRGFAWYGGVVRVMDVLRELYWALNCRISHADWANLPDRQQKRVSRAFSDRLTRAPQPRKVEGDGVKKVDYLARKTKFRGLVEVERKKFQVVLEG